jgi:hypothetical protein
MYVHVCVCVSDLFLPLLASSCLFQQAAGGATDLGKYMLEKGAYGEFLKVQEEVNRLLPVRLRLKDSTPLPHIVVVGMER